MPEKCWPQKTQKVWILTLAQKSQHIAWMHFFPYAQVFPELIHRMREVSLGEFDKEFTLRKLSILYALKLHPDVNSINSLLALYQVYPDHIQDMLEWFEEVKLLAWLKQGITQSIQSGGWGRVVDLSAKAVLLFPEQQEEIKTLTKPVWGNMLSWLRTAVERQPSIAFAEYYYNLSLLAAGEVECGMDGVVRTKQAKTAVGGLGAPLPERPGV